MFEFKRGEVEQECLNHVKDIIDGVRGDKEKERRIYFGLNEQDREVFRNIINSCVENPNKSEFPDFVSEYGIVEHFLVSSSKTSKRKGALQKRKDAEIKNKLLKELDNSDEPMTLSADYSCEEHSYNYFTESFKSSFEHHLKSLSEYKGINTTCVFMIEYQDNMLRMHESMPDNLPDCCEWGGLEYTYLTNRREYSIAYDKDILQYISEHSDMVQYVVFYNHHNADVISTKNIPYIIQMLAYNIKVHSPQGGKIVVISRC